MKIKLDYRAVNDRVTHLQRLKKELSDINTELNHQLVGSEGNAADEVNQLIEYLKEITGDQVIMMEKVIDYVLYYQEIMNAADEKAITLGGVR